MRGTLYAPGQRHEWVEFADPNDEGHYWRINVSLFLSNYNCIYGAGCPSIKHGGVADAATGCCAQGVRFTDEDDFANVSKRVQELTEEDCANLDHVRNVGWWMKRPSDGTPYKTRKKGNRCVFANPEPTKPGDPPMGCSFHALATRTGQNHNDTKPEICWKVPLTEEYKWDSYHDIGVTTLSNVSATTWGGTDGGVDEDDGKYYPPYFDYWCMDTPDAFNGKTPFYIDSKDVLVRILGEAGYAVLCDVLEEYGERKFKMPGELQNDGKPMIADLLSLTASIRQNREPNDSRGPITVDGVGAVGTASGGGEQRA